MKRKLTLITLCILAIASCVLVFTRQSPTSAKVTNQIVVARPNSPRPPEHVAYLFLFRSTAQFRKRAVEAGRPKAINPMLQKEAALNAVQTRKLDEITDDTLWEVEQQDAKARVVIQKFRAKYPNGIVPRGQKLPEPPPELQTMQEERNAIILRGRDRLRLALGEQEFSRFHEFTMKRFAGKNLMNQEQ